MFGRIALFTVAAMASTFLVGPALAQDSDNNQPRRLPSLSERLQQFRDDLFGESQPTPRRAATDDSMGADRKNAVRPNSVVRKDPPAQAPTPAAEQAVVTPQALKVQSARRAQPGTGAIASESPDEDTLEIKEPSPPIRRSAIQQSPTLARRPRDSADDEPKNEPRIARATPLPIAPKQMREPDSDDSNASRANSRAASGVLFTTESPVLSVEATGPRKVLIGKEAQFVVKIRNTGSAANNVVVMVAIPSFTEVISAQATAGTAQAPAIGERREPLEWKIDRLDAKSNANLTLKLVPRKSTPFDLAVQWTFTPEASQTLVEVQEPKLQMSISGPEEVLYGQSKMYKLTVSNPGNGDTENVMVGLLPLGHSSEGAANHRLGTLRAGDSRNIDIELTARQAGAISIKAQAFADGGLRSEATQQVMVRRAILHVEVEAPKVKYAGTVGTYHVKVVNTGNATAENVQVSAILPPDAKHVSSNGAGRFEAQQGKINWSVGTLQPGSQRVFETQCSLSTPGENRMQFVAVADGDLSAATMSSTRVEALADLKLDVRDPQGPIAVGEDAVYEVHIRNRGTKAADNIELAVFFSEGLEAIGVEGGPHEIGPGQVVFKPIATLGAAETAVFRVRARADKGGNHRFRAELVCQSLHTKLAAEEATQFYGDDKSATTENNREGEPQQAPPRESPTPVQPGEPVPIQQAPQTPE